MRDPECRLRLFCIFELTAWIWVFLVRLSCCLFMIVFSQCYMLPLRALFRMAKLFFAVFRNRNAFGSVHLDYGFLLFLSVAFKMPAEKKYFRSILCAFLQRYIYFKDNKLSRWHKSRNQGFPQCWGSGSACFWASRTRMP